MVSEYCRELRHINAIVRNSRIRGRGREDSHCNGKVVTTDCYLNRKRLILTENHYD